MNENKTFTLIRQYQLLALIYFLFFLINLLQLILRPFRWLQYFNTIFIMAFLFFNVFAAKFTKKERDDELSKQNRLMADSFVLSAITICILVVTILLPNNLHSISTNLLLTIFWFLGFFRNTAFLVYERLGRG